jgi:hypothetical protein
MLPCGWRIGKQQQTHKIDLIVALGMASWAAVNSQSDSTYPSDLSWVSGAVEPDADADAAAAAKFQAARFEQFVKYHSGYYTALRRGF